MKRLVAIFLCLIISCMSVSFAISFSDLSETKWSYKYVMSLAERGIINGYTDGTYKPQKHVTRGEFFKLIMVASEGEEFFENFQFSGIHWASSYAIAASLQGLLMDGTTIENLNDPISRLEMGVVLAKVSLHNQINDYVHMEEEINFTDINDLTDEEKLYIDYIVNIGLINGYTDGTFKPQNYMTRAEVATVIYRFLEKV